MKETERNYRSIRFAAEEVRDSLEVIIADCRESAKDEEERIREDAREARYYAAFLERLLKENTFDAEDKKTLKLALFWLQGLVRRKEEVK